MMRRAWKAGFSGILLLSITVIWAPLQGWASQEQSERLYTQGIIPFQEGRYEEALGLFQQAAVDEEPYHLAIYYLGVTYGKLGRYAEAVAPLEKALALMDTSPEPRPGLAFALQDLAVVYYHLGRYEESLRLLDKAEVAGPHNGRIHYYKGLCYVRLAQYAAARASLQRATAAPGSELSASTRDFINQITAQVQKKEREEKRWELRAGIESGFDSNVILQPDGGPVVSNQISDKDDLRLTFSAGGRFDLWRTPATYVAANYDFTQTIYPNISDFDVQAHRFRLTGAWSPVSDLTLGAEGGSNYFRLGNDDYLHELYGMPFLGYFAKPWIYTYLSYRLTDQNYLANQLVPFFDSARDGLRHELGVRQYLLLGEEKAFDRYVFVGYQYSRDNPSLKRGDDFQYTGNMAEVGGRTPLPWETSVELAYAFRNRDYAFANSLSRPPFSRARNDDTHNILVILRKPLTPFLEVNVSYLSTINSSNSAVFEYHRHIASVGFQIVY